MKKTSSPGVNNAYSARLLLSSNSCLFYPLSLRRSSSISSPFELFFSFHYSHQLLQPSTQKTFNVSFSNMAAKFQIVVNALKVREISELRLFQERLRNLYSKFRLYKNVCTLIMFCLPKMIGKAL